MGRVVHEMMRFVVSGFLLVVIVILLGRCQLGNVGVGIGLSLHDTVSVIHTVKNQVERFHYDRQKLPAENRDLGQPPPHLFGNKSPLIRHLEVLRGGLIYIQLTADNKGKPVELVYRPTVESRYRLRWTCESFNLTKEWRGVLPDVCADAPAAFDRTAYEDTSTEDYLARVTREQREAAEQATGREDEPPCVASALQAGFVRIDANQLSLWELGARQPHELSQGFSLQRPAVMGRTAFLALGDRLYFYAGDRIQVARPQLPPKASDIHLFTTSRWRWSDNRIWVNNGPALITIDPCATRFRIDTQYLMDLGAFNRITDFIIEDGVAMLSTEEAIPGSQASAIQIVRLPSNRALGFFRLEGKAHGLARAGRYLYVANDSYGVTVVDLFDLTAPRLLRRVSTRDAAMDVLVRDNQLLLADRLGGLTLYQRQDDNLTLIQRASTDITVEQLQDLGNDYISATAKDGTTTLWRWQHGLLEAVSLP